MCRYYNISLILSESILYFQVNEEVSSKLIPLTVTGSSHTIDHKQMSHFDSCLTKLLYFFPCPGGGGGNNW